MSSRRSFGGVGGAFPEERSVVSPIVGEGGFANMVGKGLWGLGGVNGRMEESNQKVVNCTAEAKKCGVPASSDGRAEKLQTNHALHQLTAYAAQSWSILSDQ